MFLKETTNGAARRKRLWVFAGISVASTALGCGSRTELSPVGGGAAAGIECLTDIECPRDPCVSYACVSNSCEVVDEVECVSDDPCFEAECNSETGQCEERRLTVDQDRDGFFAPLAGRAPGEPGACGNDCDDSRAEAFPGGLERCDGVDNDCDGIIDNGSRYLGTTEDLPLVDVPTGDISASAGRGIAFGDGVFAVGYWGENPVQLSYLRGLDGNGREVFPQTKVTPVNATSFGVDVAFDGAGFGSVWSDPRADDNYEVFFARFSADGEKLGPERRLTNAPDFSVHAQILYDQGRFVVVFDDRRTEEDGIKVFAQLVGVDGEPIGSNRQLTPSGQGSEFPDLAATVGRYGLAYLTSFDGGDAGVHFRSFDKNFEDPTEQTVLVDAGATNPNVIALGDRFLVTWDIYDFNATPPPGDVIMGALLSERGELIDGPTPLTSGDQFARNHSTLSLGDRLLLVWSGYSAGSYDLYGKVMSSELVDIEPRTVIVAPSASTMGSSLALGDQGKIGILFTQQNGEGQRARFTAIGCDARGLSCDCRGCLTGGLCPECCDPS